MRTSSDDPRRARTGAGVFVAALAVIAAAVVALTSLASAKSAHPTVSSAHNAHLGKNVLVDSHGRTLYQLAPETTHHLLCKTSQCYSFWPPVKVASAKAKLIKGGGVKGKLGIMHRDGFFQVTLGGRPLYRFSGDSGKGQAAGQGIKGFGGTWHVVSTAATSRSGSGTSTTTTSTKTTTTSTSSTYSYPAY
jgi:predicted lipoprotein with Yx(FWY)xxD motif